ncbi:MAG: DUF177 domain-containing protein [Bacteroidota bacterium]|nr:DUF177 domain-containing protein [Bacteroidota bacterium]
MKAGKDYKIQFAGLSTGEHTYEFEVGDKFFENLEYSEIKKSSIHIDLILLKQSTMMMMEFKISGTVKMDCDLCNVEFDLPISGEHKLIVKVGGHLTGDEDDDIITVAANEHELDLSQYLYEYIALSLPIKRIHPPDAKGKSTCDKEVLKKLKKFLTEKEKEDPEDPRWNDLKNIKLN